MLFQSNEKHELIRIAYARAGCYFFLQEDYFRRILRLAGVRSGDMTQISDMNFFVHILNDGKPERYHYYGDEGSLCLISPTRYVDVALTADDEIRFRGAKNAGLRLELSSNMEGNGAAGLDSIVRLKDGGRQADLLWGYTDGGRFTSEFPAHMMSHVARLKVSSENRVVMHCHPANLLAITYVHDLDEKQFTRTLWQMCTECVVVFPDGVNVLPWMLCGTNEIGEATAEKMKTARLVVWSQHGIYGAGKDLDETFGLIETAEKAAEIYMKIAHLPRINTITDEQMHLLEKRFNIKAREGYLD